MRGLLPADDWQFPFDASIDTPLTPERSLGRAPTFSDDGTFLRLLTADRRVNLCDLPPLKRGTVHRHVFKRLTRRVEPASAFLLRPRLSDDAEGRQQGAGFFSLKQL